MSVLNKNVKDTVGYDYNVFTEELDIVRKFNVNRIVTAERNSAGSLNMIYDPASGQYIEMGPQPITDNEGNLIVIGR